MIALANGHIIKIEHLGVDGVVTLKLPTGVVIKAKTRKHTEMTVGDTFGIRVCKKNALLYIDGTLSPSLN